jgi:RNA-directed DNA polymerase
MGLFEFLKRLIQPEDEGMVRSEPGKKPAGKPSHPGLPLSDLARRLKMTEEELRRIEPLYHEFAISKRSGGQRRIYAPALELKAIQRRILGRVLARLKCHPAAKGFERGQSIVTNALPHVRQAVVLRMDLKNYFESTKVERVRDFFLRIGWGKEAAEILLKLCTHRGGLPPGAPTSPRLSNLINFRMDQRLTSLAKGGKSAQAYFRNPRTGGRVTKPLSTEGIATYTRYADDLTFSFPGDDAGLIHRIVFLVKRIVKDEGYELHMKKKLHIRRRHDRQQVTGLVVNERLNLPRPVRRRIRAVEHHLRTGRPASLTPARLAGWKALQAMIAKQSEG